MYSLESISGNYDDDFEMYQSFLETKLQEEDNNDEGDSNQEDSDNEVQILSF